MIRKVRNDIPPENSEFGQFIEHLKGDVTANSIIGEVQSFGTVSSGVTTNQTIDMRNSRYAEVFVNADVTLNFTNIQNGTLKFLTVITQTSTIRNITFQLDGVTQETTVVGDGSTTNSKHLFTIIAFETQKYISSNTVLVT